MAAPPGVRLPSPTVFDNAGAMGDFVTRREWQSGQSNLPLADCSSKAAMLANQPSKAWPLPQLRLYTINPQSNQMTIHSRTWG